MRNIMMGPAQHLDGAGGRYVEQIRKMMTTQDDAVWLVHGLLQPLSHGSC